MAHENESDKANGVEREWEKRGGTKREREREREIERERESREWNDHN